MSGNISVFSIGMVITMVSLLSSCTGSGMFSVAPDTSNRIAHVIRLSEWTLGLTIPGGHENEMWDRLRVQDINLDWDKNLQNKQAVQAFNASWEYKGFVGEGLFGRLRVKVWVLPRADGYANDLVESDQLATYLKSRHSNQWDPINEQYLRNKQDHLIVNLPANYDRVVINSRQWLRFKYGGQFDFYGYAIGLREDRYVQVEFDYIDNTGGKKRQDWRPDAERLREEIAATLRLEQKEKTPM